MAGLAALLRLQPDPAGDALADELGRMLALIETGRGLARAAQTRAPAALGLVHPPGPAAGRSQLGTSGRVVAALDGELEIDLPPERWAQRLAAEYEHVGLRAVAALRGAFCGAIWDAAAGELHLFTDRFGLGVLHHARCGDTLAASTQLRALLALPDFRVRPSRRAVADLFNHGFVLGDDTLAEDVALVPPASVVSYDREGRCRTWRYWRPRFAADPADEAEAADRLDEAFARSILTHRQQIPGRWGVTLSGGLDSRLAAAVLREHDERPLTAVTYGPESSNEYRFAHLAADALGLDHHRIGLDPESMLRGYPRAVWLTDAMAAVSDLYFGGRFERLREFMDVRLDGYLGDAMLGGTYLSERLRGARDFDDCWPWLDDKMQRWVPRFGRVLDRAWTEQITRSREPRVRAQWEAGELEGRACDRSEWFLCQNRGRRFIHCHHGLLVRGVVRSVKPFMSYDCLDATWDVPFEQRLGHRFYDAWVRRRHPRMAELPFFGSGSIVAPARPDPWPGRVDQLRKWVRLLTFGRVGMLDRTRVDPNGWAASAAYRRAVKDFVGSERAITRGYVEPGRFRAYLSICDGQDAFVLLSILYQLEWFHRLFEERDRDALAEVGAPVDAVAPG